MTKERKKKRKRKRKRNINTDENSIYIYSQNKNQLSPFISPMYIITPKSQSSYPSIHPSLPIKHHIPTCTHPTPYLTDLAALFALSEENTGKASPGVARKAGGLEATAGALPPTFWLVVVAILLTFPSFPFTKIFATAVGGKDVIFIAVAWRMMNGSSSSSSSSSSS